MILKKHLDEKLLGRSDTTLYHFRLEGGYRRWVKGKNPHVRYAFTVIKEEPIPADDDVAAEIKGEPVAAEEGQR